MAEFVPSRLSLDPVILGRLESIAKKQGALSARRRDVRHDFRIESVAAIDAVHFSTKIEGNALSRDQVTRALQTKAQSPGGRSRDLKEVLNYSRTRSLVQAWSRKQKAFDDSWVLTHHTELLKGILKGRLRGHYRNAQCVVSNASSREIIYIAPAWEDVVPLMRGMLRWLRRQWVEGASPILIAAQFHFEFVTIHPFMDGNGRLARLLTNGLLLAGGYDVENYAALEKQHERDRTAYYRALRELQAGNYYDIAPGHDIRSWVAYWVGCLSATYDEALERLNGAVSLSLEDSSGAPSDDRLAKALGLFRRHRRLRAAEYADLVGVGRTQAVEDLNRLAESGAIARIGGGRSTSYEIREKSSPGVDYRRGKPERAGKA